MPRTDEPHPARRLAARCLLGAGGPRLALEIDVDGTFSVRNDGDAPCRVSRLADGALTIAAVHRAGTALAPVLRSTYYHDGQAAARDAELTDLEPGRSLPLAVAAPLPAAEAPARWLASVPRADTGPALVAAFHLAEPGGYEVTASFAPPAAAPGGGDGEGGAAGPGAPAPCPPAAIVAVGTVVVPGPPGSGPPWTAICGVAGAAALALGLVVVRRRRRGPGAAALVVLTAATLVPVVLSADPAEARIEVSPGASAGFRSAVDACFARIFDAGDPAGTFARAANAGRVVRIQESVFDSATTPDDLGAAADPARGSDSVIVWNPTNTSPYKDGVSRDPCGVLYHELNHGADAATGTDRGGPCGSSGISVAEVNATRAENAYRQKAGLPPRTTYGDRPLPAGADPCRSGPNRPGRGPRRDDCADGSCGSASGDPHLRTFDQLRYSLQTVGEYVLTRSTEDDFEVQVRHTPYPASRVVSVVGTVVAHVGGVAFQFEPGAAGELSVLADGRPIELPAGEEGVPLGQGATAGVEPSARGEGAWVAGADGTVVLVSPIGSWGLDVEVAPAAGRAGRLEGLLGDFDGDPDDDLADAAGEVRLLTDGALPTTEDITEVSDTWRLTEATSRFTYPEGRGTADFTDRGFPDAPPAPSAAAREAAAAVCRSLLDEANAEFAACVLDVAMTGVRAFAEAAADRSATAGPAGGGTTPTTQPGTTPTSGPPSTTTSTVVVGSRSRLGPGGRLDLAGELAVPGQVDVFEVDLAAGQVAYLQTEGLNPGCTTAFAHRVDLVAPDGRSLLGGWDCSLDPRRVVIGAGGTHRVEVRGDVEATGPYRLALLDSGPDQDFALVLGAEVGPDVPGPGAGRLERPGTVDRYRFEGRPGQVVFLQTEELNTCGAAAFTHHLELTAPSGRSALVGWACSGDPGRVVLDEAGTYTVTASGDVERTGEYRFVLHDSGPDQAFALQLPAEVAPDRPGPGAGRIERPGTRDVHRFEAAAGQRLRLAGDPACTPRSAQQVEVTAPSGARVATAWTCSGFDPPPIDLPEAGTYTVTVSGDAARTGSYQLRLSLG